MTALAYGIACYAVFLGTFLYAIGFLGNFVVPRSIDTGTAGSAPLAIAVNLALLALFALQHSVMARPAFKRAWTRLVPESVERSTYVLFSSLALILLFAFWQPMRGSVWHVEASLGRDLLYAMYFLGIATILYSTILIDHFDLFGLRQVVFRFRNRSYTQKPFESPSLYRYIRHPLYVGWFLTVWMTPDMSLGHLLFALGCSAYILAAIPFEERDLQEALGDDYSEWRERTPMFVPRVGATPDSQVCAIVAES
jgi:protein-S-isoprenylcysteine O-methyltransferase Ste14